MDEAQITKLITTARQLRQRAHAPYSGYKVGAAVMTADGKIVGGCNVESASYGLTCCAERVALYRAVAQGQTDFVALAVATWDGGSPCGACRQVIWELCGSIPVYVAAESGSHKVYQSHQLLPAAFGKESLL